MTTPHAKTRSASRLTALTVVLGAADLLSCFASPETCRLCNETVPDGSPGTGGEGAGGTAQSSTGGLPGGTGGRLGDAGHPGSGGTGASSGGSGMAGTTGSSGGSAGATATGGSNSGGSTSSGGAATGGKGGAGGTATGGSVGSGGAGGRGMEATGGGAGGVTGSGGGMGGNGMASGGAGGGGAGGRGGAGGGGGAAIDPDLVLWYKFDESSGTTAADSAMFGGMARNGTLTNVSTGTASFSTTAKVGSHSVSLTGTSTTAGGYVSVPNLSTVAPGALTVACWIYLTADRNWQRVFDFGKVPASGSQPTTYLFLTAHQTVTSPASMRFGISTGGPGSEQVINMSTPAVPSLNAWHHVAVTLGAGATYTGTLYIDKAVAGTNTAMSLHWSDLGATDQNTFGRSQFSADQYFAGMLDDCRVYRRALSAAEITALP